MRMQVVTAAINPCKMSRASISQVESILALPIYVRVGKWSGETGSSNPRVRLSHSVLVVLLSSGHRDPLNSLSGVMLLSSGHRDPLNSLSDAMLLNSGHGDPLKSLSDVMHLSSGHRDLYDLPLSVCGS